MISIRNRQCFAAVAKVATLASSPVKLTCFGGPLPTGPENEAVPMTRFRVLTLGCIVATAVSFVAVERAQAEAKLLIDAATGRVLYADNATQPWYPASVTKLM